MLQFRLTDIFDIFFRNHFHRNRIPDRQIQFCQIPLIIILIRTGYHVYRVFHIIIHHVEDRIAHVISIQHMASFFVNNLSLFVHYLVIFQQIFTDSEVVALDLFLCFFNRTGKHLMLDLLAVFHTKCIEHIHQSFRSEQSHQIIFQGNVESGFSRIPLTSGTSTQLVIDTSGFMPLGSDDLKTSGRPCFIIQFDIRTTACHVCCDGYRIMDTCLCNDFSFQFMELGIQYVVFDAAAL